MPKLKEDKKMSRGERDFHYSKSIICCKWYDNKPVLLVATNADGMSGVSNVMKRTKGSATKTLVSCPNIIKPYKNGMGCIDITELKLAAFRLDCKSKLPIYLRMFFDLIDAPHVNSHFAYTKLGNNISLLWPVFMLDLKLFLNK